MGRLRYTAGAAAVVAIGAIAFAPAVGAQAGQSVEMNNAQFSPAAITVTAGTTVTWTNNDTVGHTVSFEGGVELGSSDCGTGTDVGSVCVAPGTSVHRMFTSIGPVTYFCQIHKSQGMTGTIMVVAPTTTTTTTRPTTTTSTTTTSTTTSTSTTTTSTTSTTLPTTSTSTTLAAPTSEQAAATTDKSDSGSGGWAVLLVVMIGAVIAGISFVGARLYHMRTAGEGPSTPVPDEPPPDTNP